MERKGDILLNLSCSKKTNEGPNSLPKRMPDGRSIYKDPKLKTKILKTHIQAFGSSNVFIPKHKLPVLDEFGLFDSKPEINKSKDLEPKQRELPSNTYKRLLPQQQDQSSTNHHQKESTSNHSAAPNGHTNINSKKRKRRREKESEPMIIPKEVQEVAGGLPPSFPQYRMKKFTEEYHRRKEENAELNEPVKKRKRTFTPGLNPRRKEKAPNIFSDTETSDLENLHPYLVSNLKDNFLVTKLTKIQSLAMPQLLQTRISLTQKEFIINAGVGSGKTLSYVAPIVNNLALLEPKITREDGIFALVLLPTRELAATVSDVFMKLCRSFTRIVPGLLTGGERKKSEKARLRKGLNILVTTPGRLIDHMEHSKNMDFKKLQYCVLGDVHRLLDPERAETAKKIAIVLRKKLPRDCVRCAVTSTLTAKLHKLLDIILTKPIIIDGFKQYNDDDDDGSD